jgi:hypothetical protein
VYQAIRDDAIERRGDPQIGLRFLECPQIRFGGLAFLVGGNMAVAASGQGGLMLRCDPTNSDELVAEQGASRMVMRGKEMDGWLRVEDAALRDDASLSRWVDVGVGYASSLPAK